MSTYRLDQLFSPRSVAVVGASPRPTSPGRAVLGNLKAGFAGAASGAAQVPWANAKLSRVGANQPVAKRKSLCAHPDPGGFMKTNLKLMTCIANASYGDFPSFASVAYVLRFLLFVFSLMNPYQIETEPVSLRRTGSRTS